MVDKFHPDLSIRRALTPTESSCFRTLEAILVETAENHDVFVTSDEDEERIASFVSSGGGDDSEYMPVDTQVGEGSSIEESMTPERMGNIMESFLATGQRKCLSKHRISYSQLRSVERHFAEGDAEHLKTREVRSRVLQKFTEVSLVIHYFLCLCGPISNRTFSPSRPCHAESSKSYESLGRFVRW